MSGQEPGKPIPGGDPVAVELRLAVHAGDVEAIQRLLQNDPALVQPEKWPEPPGVRKARREAPA